MKLRFSLRKSSFLLFLLLLIPCLVPAQNVSPAAEFENLLNTQAVTYAQASRFVLEAADVLVTRDVQEAFEYVVNQRWLPENIGADDEARLDHVALLLVKAFNINGGLLYSVTGNARYAYRELRYMNVIQGRVVSSMPVTGERLIFYVNRLLVRQGN